MGQRGVALVAVLWMTAALTVLLSSLAMTARTELSYQHYMRAEAEARALADGAINSVASWLMASSAGIGRQIRLTVNVAGEDVQVIVSPGTGYIDLNHAPPRLLIDLFEFGAGLPMNEAEQLAEQVVTWRTEGDLSGEDDPWLRFRHAPFRTPEDLRQVPGITPEIFDSIRGLVTVGLGSYGQVNPAAAPEGVLLVLAHGDGGLVDDLLAAREEQDEPGILPDMTGLVSEFVELGVSGVFRVEAIVGRGGQHFSRVRWIDVSMLERGIFPWKIVRTEPVRSIVIDDRH